MGSLSPEAQRRSQGGEFAQDQTLSPDQSTLDLRISAKLPTTGIDFHTPKPKQTYEVSGRSLSVGLLTCAVILTPPTTG